MTLSEKLVLMAAAPIVIVGFTSPLFKDAWAYMASIVGLVVP